MAQLVLGLLNLEFNVFIMNIIDFPLFVNLWICLVLPASVEMGKA